MMHSNFSSKTMKTLGIAAVTVAPITADAAIVHVTGSPLTVSVTESAGWDVDGTGAAEFEFRNQHSVAFLGGRTFSDDNVLLYSGGSLNGRGLAGRQPDGFSVAVLHRSQHVGPTLPSSLTIATAGSYGRGVMRANRVRSLYSTRSISASAPAGGPFYDFGQQPGFLGFAFDPGGGLRYGWAKLQFDEDGYNSSLTISEWAYEDEPGEAIHVGSVPAPPAAVAGLTMLAMGAAGVRAHRRSRRDMAAS
jgi:hypothetical protein